MRTSHFLGLLMTLVGLAATTLGASHPKEYFNGTGDALLDVNPDGILFQPGTCVDAIDLGLIDWGQGGVCFDAGHVVPNILGEAVLSIVDDIFNPVGGYYCQDLDADYECGEVVAPCLNSNVPEFENRPAWFWTCNRAEPAVDFCGSVWLQSPLDPTPRSKAAWAGGFNWEPSAAIYIFINGPINGNPVLPNPCGPFLSMGTHGVVVHS